MSVNVSGCLRLGKPERTLQLLYRLLMIDDVAKCQYIFDDDSVGLIQLIPDEIPGLTVKELVDIVILRVIALVPLSSIVREKIFHIVRATGSADLILAHLDHITGLCIDIIGFHDNVVKRTDLSNRQILAILRKWWSKIDIEEYAILMYPSHWQPRTHSGLYDYSVHPYMRTFVTSVDDHKLRIILQCLYGLPGFVTKMSTFINSMFAEAIFCQKASHVLDILCSVGFIPSVSYIVELFLTEPEKSIRKFRIIMSYYPDLMQVFVQIDYVTRCLLHSYQSNDHVILYMLQILQSGALDYAFDALPDYSLKQPESHLKQYGLHCNPLIQHYFGSHVASYRLLYWRLPYDSPMITRISRWDPHNRTIKAHTINEHVRTSMINTLLKHSKNCREILNSAY